ncbi:MAG: aldehyde dehydrogenase [Flavobacteriales bacterium]|nr:aldehyde dehydrogenase [Flavobacteriales bacterium]|tara:strand:+ start:2282 stop:3661 length:1380 start_codon:yes stop_codon:yes gene_type:complete
MNQISKILKAQNDFFETNVTLNIKYRKNSLISLKKVVLDAEGKIIEALHRDLRKPKFEAYTAEIATVISELDYFIRNIEKLAKPRRVKSSLLNFPSTDYIYSDPYGKVLVVASWNYPFQLILSPLIAAIAAGNCVVCKPSEISKHTSNLIAKLIAKVFNPEHVSVIEGGKETSDILLKQNWDYIFFTGSTSVGKIFMKAAAQQLCPITLELGGKSPVIVNKDAQIEVAAKRIVWGKLFNAGQTCIAPDYLYVHKDIAEKLTNQLKIEFDNALGKNKQNSEFYARIVNHSHFHRIVKLFEKEKVIYGGKSVEKDKYIEPTLLNDIDWNSPIMKEEIFGPILPILTFDKLDETISLINKKEKPLAAYYFGQNAKDQNIFLKKLYFGGGCINDTILQVSNSNLPFGGVGASGMGAYHGEKSFRCFSHEKAILKRGTWMDFPFRFAPYRELKWIKYLFKLIRL